MAQPRTSTSGGESRIGTAARIRGRVQGDGDLVVEGHVEGDLALRGHLTVAEGGSVSCDTVDADSVTIAGSLQGQVAASGAVQLASTARVRGNLKGSAVTIAEGARFSGRLDCDFDLPQELGGTAREARTKAPTRR
jgi:cytoskeletal protein CcmA (bactofilin family)